MLASVTVFCMIITCAPTPDGVDMATLVPKTIRGWTPKQADGLYDAESLFKYIDGGAEVYRSFNIQRALGRSFAKADAPDIIADVFDMGTSRDAYGVYHHDYREGSTVGIGQESEYLEGTLAFWKDRYCVSILTVDENPDSKAAVLELGKAIAAAIPTEGSPPAILQRLPEKGLQRRHLHYFHDHFCLNTHYYLSDNNLLALGKDTEGVVARYSIGDVNSKDFAVIVLVEYPSAEKANAAFTSFKAGYVPEADTQGFAKIENGKWVGIQIKKTCFVGIFDAPTREIAQTLINKIGPIPEQSIQKGEPAHE